MHLVSSLFMDNFEIRQVPGPATRIDITGAFFSTVATGDLPLTLTPHFVALIFCEPTEKGEGIFEVVFRKGISSESEQIARNVSPFRVDPGKFTYRLVRAELEFTEYCQIFAHCRIDQDTWHIVPLTLLPPVAD